MFHIQGIELKNVKSKNLELMQMNAAARPQG